MARARTTYLSREERQFVHEQAVCLLEEIGVGSNMQAAFEVPPARVRRREQA